MTVMDSIAGQINSFNSPATLTGFNISASAIATVGFSAFQDINDPLDSLMIGSYFTTTLGTGTGIEVWTTERMGG